MKTKLERWVETAIILSAIIAILAITAGECKSQDQWDYSLVDQFYSDADQRGISLERVEVKIKVAALGESNGGFQVQPNGSVLLILDNCFYNYYHEQSQVKRLVYLLLAEYHQLASTWGPKKGVIDPERLYYKLRTRHIDQLFNGKSISHGGHTRVPPRIEAVFRT